MCVIIVIALVTQITAVILLEYLLPPPALGVQCGSNCVIAPSSSDHAAFLIFVAEAFGRFEASRARGLEVFRGDGSRDWRRVGALEVGGIGHPPCCSKCGVVQDIGVDIDQSLTDTVLD